MGWYEAIKDGINAAQKADNIPLLNNLIDIQKQMLDLLEENTKLKNEILELKSKDNLTENIERHTDAYITLKNDPKKLIYCSNCCDTKKVLVQAQIDGDGRYFCPSCQYIGYYDKDKYNRLCNNINTEII